MSTKAREYIRNLGKSLLFSAKNVVGSEMPNVIGLYDKNKDIISSGVSYLTEMSHKSNKGTFAATNMTNKFLKDVEDIKKRAFEDLKTGKFVNFDRDSSKFMDDMDLDEKDIDFNLSSIGFEDGDDPDVTFDDADRTVHATRVATTISELGSNRRTKAVMSTMIDTSEKSANYLATTAHKLNSMNMGLMSQMHTDAMKMATDTNSLLTSIVEFHNSKLIDHFNRTNEYYDASLAELRLIREALTKEHEASTGKRSQYDDVFGMGGMNFKEYGNAIKKNFETWLSATPLGLAASLSSGSGGIMNTIKASPLSFISDLMISGLMPKSLKATMKNLDNSVAGLFSALILRLNEMKSSLSSPMKNFIGNIFGLSMDTKRSIDVGTYHKGAMQYNGRADKALTEVIPTLLSNILSAVKGSDKVAIYNYDTGRFVNAKAIRHENDKQIRAASISRLSDAKSEMRRRMGAVGGDTEFMMEELERFLHAISKSDKMYNPYKAKKSTDFSGMDLKDPRSYEFLRQAFMSMPKHMQNKFVRDTISARQESTRISNTLSNEAHIAGTTAAYSGLNEIVGSGKYMENPNTSLLKSIRNILTEGIKVYNMGNFTPSKKERDKVIRRSVASHTGGAPLPPHTKSKSSANKKDSNDFLNMDMDELKTRMKAVRDYGYDHGAKSATNRLMQAILQENTVGGKFRVVRDSMKPANIIGRGINKLDSFIHRLVYGSGSREGETDGDGAAPKTFFSKVASKFGSVIDGAAQWIDTKVLSPMHDKFFGPQGLFTKFQETMEPFLEKMKEQTKQGWAKFKTVFMGEKNSEGYYTGGILSDVQNSFMDYSNKMRHFFTGAGYKTSDGKTVETNNKTSVMGYIKNYSKSILENVKTGLFGDKYETDELDPDTGEIKKVTKRKGDGLLSGVMSHLKLAFKSLDSLFKRDSNQSDEEVERDLSKWRKDMKGFLPKGLAGGALGMAASIALPGGPLLWGFMGSTIAFAQHSKKFREFLFGSEDRDGLIPRRYQTIATEIKKTMPSITAGGILGMGASMVLPGGPLLGLTLGSAIGFAAKSEKVQEYLFGKTDEKGNLLKKGVLGPEFKEKLKKFIPAMGAGGILGMGASIFLPGGPLLGLTIGSAVGFATKSTKVQELLFGKFDDKGNLITKGLITPQMRESIKKHLPKGIAGAAFGGLSAFLSGGLLPGGPLVGAMVGASINILSSSEKFKDFLFGGMDEDGKRKGGLFGSVRDFIKDEFLTPFKHWFNKKGIVIKDWFQNAISTPLMNAMTPLKQAFNIIGGNIKNSWSELKESFKTAFVDTFNKNVGIPLKDFITKNITDPLKDMLNKFFNIIGKGISGIMTAPIKGLAIFADSIVKADREKNNKAYKKMGMSEVKHTPFDIDTGMNLDMHDPIDREFKDTIMEGRKKKLKEKLKEYNRANGLIDLDPNDPLDMEFREFIRSKNKGVTNPKRVNHSDFDKYFEEQMRLTRASKMKYENSTGVPDLPTQRKGGITMDLQRFAGKVNPAMVGQTAMPGLPGPRVFTEIKSILTSIGGHLKGIGTSVTELTHLARTEHDTKIKTNPFIGQLDLDKLRTQMDTNSKNLKDIRNEVHGQLDGVGYHIDMIANIMLDLFGMPSIHPKDIKRRGNRRKRGIFGRLVDFIKNPFKMMGTMAKNLLVKPFQAIFAGVKKYTVDLIKQFGSIVWTAAKLPFQILKGVTTGIGKILNSPITKQLTKLVGTLINGLLVKPLKGVFNVLEAAGRGVLTMAKGLGVAAKDTIVGMYNLSKQVIPTLATAVTSLTKGVWGLTKGITSAVATMTRVFGSIIGGTVRGIGRGIGALFNMKRLKKLSGSLSGMAGNPVYVVGGTLDRVGKVDTIEVLNHIRDIVNVFSNDNPGKQLKPKVATKRYSSDMSFSVFGKGDGVNRTVSSSRTVETTENTVENARVNDRLPTRDTVIRVGDDELEVLDSKGNVINPKRQSNTLPGGYKTSTPIGTMNNQQYLSTSTNGNLALSTSRRGGITMDLQRFAGNGNGIERRGSNTSLALPGPTANLPVMTTSNGTLEPIQPNGANESFKRTTGHIQDGEFRTIKDGEDSGESSSKSSKMKTMLEKTKATTFRAAGLFAKAGAVVDKLSKSKFNDTVPRILSIESITKTVKTEQDYYNATLGLLNEIAVSNIQVLGALHDQSTGDGLSLADIVKGIGNGLSALGNTLKNLAPWLAAALIPALTSLLKKFGDKLKNGGSDTPDGISKPAPGARGGGSTIIGGGATAKGGPSLPRAPFGPMPLALPGPGSNGRQLQLPGTISNTGNKLDDSTYKNGAPKTSPYKVVDGRFVLVDDAPNMSNIIDESGKPVNTSGGMLSKLKGLGGKAANTMGGKLGLLSIGLLGYNLYDGYTRAQAAETEIEAEAARTDMAGSVGAATGGILGGITAGAAMGALAGAPTGPGAVITALLGGTAGAFLGEAGMRKLYQNKDSILTPLSNAKNWAMDTTSGATDWVKDKGSAIWNSAPVETTRNIVTGIKDMTVSVIGGLVDGTKEILDAIGDRVSDEWDKFTDAFGEKWDKYIAKPVDKAFGVIQDYWNDFATAINKVWNTYVAEPAENALGTVKEGWNATTDWIAKKWSSWIIEPLMGWVDTFKTGWNTATSWLSGVWGTYVINPLSDFFTSVKSGWDRMLGWIDDKFGGFFSAVGETWTGIKSGFTKAGTTLKSMWDSMWTDRGATAKKIMQDKGSEIREAETSIGSRIANWIRGRPKTAEPSLMKDTGGGDPVFADNVTSEYGYALNKSKFPKSDMTAQDLPMVTGFAKQYGLNPHLVMALIQTESMYNSKAQASGSTAKGWGQILDTTAKYLYEDVMQAGYFSPNKSFDKKTNAQMTALYLSRQIRDFGGDIRKGVMAYNVGAGTIRSGKTSYGAENGARYFDLIRQRMKENSGLDIMQGTNVSASGTGGYSDNNADAGSDQSIYSVISDLSNIWSTKPKDLYGIDPDSMGDMGTAWTDKAKTYYGVDPDQVSNDLSGSLMAMADPFYVKGAGGSGSYSGDYAGAGNSNELKQRVMSKYNMLNGETAIHDFFAARLQAIASAYGKPITINSGWRSDEEQRQLIRRWHKENPGSTDTERRKWVADPERNNHAVGVAADISGWMQNLPDSTLAKYGLYRPMSYEQWHFEPIELRNMDRSRQALEPIFGSPMNPNPGMGRYIDSRYNPTGVGNGIGGGDPSYIDVRHVGGGDPVFADNKLPDVSDYANRAEIAVVRSKDNHDVSNAKIIELLSIIAQSSQTLVDISDENRAYLQQISKTGLAGGITTTEVQPAVIIGPEASSNNNVFTGGGGNSQPQPKSKGDKSGVARMIAQGRK